MKEASVAQADGKGSEQSRVVVRGVFGSLRSAWPQIQYKNYDVIGPTYLLIDDVFKGLLGIFCHAEREIHVMSNRNDLHPARIRPKSGVQSDDGIRIELWMVHVHVEQQVSVPHRGFVQDNLDGAASKVVWGLVFEYWNVSFDGPTKGRIGYTLGCGCLPEFRDARTDHDEGNVMIRE